MENNKKKKYLLLLFIVSFLIIFLSFDKDILVEKNEKIDSFLKFKSILVSLKNLSENEDENGMIINEELKKLTFFREKNIEKQTMMFEDNSFLSFKNIVSSEGFVFYNLEFKNNNFNDCLSILKDKNVLENSLEVKIKNKKTSNYIFLKNDFINELEDKKIINNFCKNDNVEIVISKKEFLIN